MADMDKTQEDQIAGGLGFFAALDQSGGSTPKALADYGIEEAAYQLRGRDVRPRARDAHPGDHQPGLRRLADPRGDPVRADDGPRRSTASRPARVPVGARSSVVPFLKVDKGLADEQHGVQLMKPIDTLDDLLDTREPSTASSAPRCAR